MEKNTVNQLTIIYDDIFWDLQEIDWLAATNYCD